MIMRRRIITTTGWQVRVSTDRHRSSISDSGQTLIDSDTILQASLQEVLRLVDEHCTDDQLRMRKETKVAENNERSKNASGNWNRPKHQENGKKSQISRPNWMKPGKNWQRPAANFSTA